MRRNRAEYERTVELPAPPDVVFWDLLEPEHVPDYDPSIRSWRARAVPPVVGTRIDFVGRFGAFWAKGVSEVTGFEPPGHFAVRLVSPPTPFRSRLTWDLAPRNGGTAFTYRFVLLSPPGLGAVGRRMLGVWTDHLDDALPALAGRYG